MSHCVSMVVVQEPECSPASRTQTAASLQGPECPCLVPSRGAPICLPHHVFPCRKGWGSQSKAWGPCHAHNGKIKTGKAEPDPCLSPGGGSSRGTVALGLPTLHPPLELPSAHRPRAPNSGSPHPSV